MKTIITIKIKRIISILICAAIMGYFTAGCLNDTDEDSRNDNNDYFREHIYITGYRPLPEHMNNASNPVYHNGKLYFTSTTESTVSNSVLIDRIYSTDLDGSGFTEVSGYSPEIPHPDALGYIYITAMRIDDNGSIWIVEQSRLFCYDLPSDFDGDDAEISKYYMDLGQYVKLKMLSITGTEMQSINLVSVPGLSGSVNSFEIDNNGNIYIHDDSNIYILDNIGGKIFNLRTNDIIRTLIHMQDGSVACIVSDHTLNSMSLRMIDLKTQEWGEKKEITSSYTQAAYPGDKGFDLLIDDKKSLSGVVLGTGETEIFFDWITVGIGSNERYVRFLSDEQILCVEKILNEDSLRGTLKITILSITAGTGESGRITLTIAGFGLTQELNDAIAEFNRSSSKYLVQFIDYTQYSQGGAWLSGLERLSTELIAGQIPDILETRLLPFDKYVEKGLFVDLYDFIDSDSEYSRDSFVTGALRALEMNGGLYQIVPEFYVSTVVGNPAILGAEQGWTIDEFLAVINANPNADFPLGIEWTKESFIQTVLRLNIEDYIDRGNGTAHFDSDSFIQLLEFADTLPSQYSTEDLSQHELIASGRQLMIVINLFHDFYYLQIYKAIFDGDFMFKGFPAENRSGNKINYQSGLAITTDCSDKEGAWEFIRTLLKNNRKGDSFYFPSSLPLNKEAFDIVRTKMMAEHNHASTFNYNDFIVNLHPMTKEEDDQLMTLIDSLSGISIFDVSLLNIVTEGASDFFNGRSSARDAARIIQSRVSIYISEQSG